jgi:hypothetical protein
MKDLIENLRIILEAIALCVVFTIAGFLLICVGAYPYL